VSSISQVKAEAQKLIKRYNQLQAEAKAADSAEAARKVAEAEKLVSQISSLQEAITKLQAKDREVAAANKKITGVIHKPASETPLVKTLTLDNEIAETEKQLLENRINRIEDAQRKTRAQIDQLTRAKAELARLREEAEKSASTLAQERRRHEERLQQEINKLLAKKEAEQVSLKRELEIIRKQAAKEAELLKVQRDAARAMMEKQKQLESDNILAVRQIKKGNRKGLWLGIVIGGLISVAVVATTIFFTPLGQQFLETAETPPKPPKSPKPPEKTTPTVEKSPHHQQPEEPQLVTKSLGTFQDRLSNGGVGPIMMKLPGGTFTMGNKGSTPYQDERPAHQVTLQGFAISKYEITFEEYDVFANHTERTLPKDEGWGRGKLPVVNVNLDDAMEYTKWLTEQSGHQYRLPSEREWEYAAAAGTETPYWWGYKLLKNYANCATCGSQWDGVQPAPVGSFPANAFGLHDTIGNILEWTSTCYHPSYQGSPEAGQEWEGGNCSKRMVRSSSFQSYEKDLRTTKRFAFSPRSKINNLGFRVVQVD